ncbi:MAG: M10 family metallopeptidase, partial [Methylococcaceae bacterium]
MTTTNPLDGLLAIRDGSPTARWNFPDAVGTPASSPGGIGNAATVSFSFLTAVPSYYPIPNFDPSVGFAAFSGQQKQAVRDVLTSITDMIQLSFTEVPTTGSISFGLNNQSGSSGFGFFPGFGYRTSNGDISGVTANDSAGDVWINGSKAWTATDFSLGGSGYGALVHEIGHALGLKHPFEAGTGDAHILDASLLDVKYTVMAYESPPIYYRTVTEATPGNFSKSYKPILPETLMPLDIQALQYLYGTNTSFHTGDDTYTFDTSRPFIQTLYDAGGNDTLSVANFSLGCVLDLTSGRYSSISIPSGALPPGDVENNPVTIYDGTDNLAIAYGSIIENATGGSGNDQLLGNAVANILNGGVGADTMQGGDGSDIYYVDNKNDRVTETNATAATGGVDLVNSYLNTYTLGANIENGAVLATGAANLTGNGLDNTLYAGAGNNTLNGGARTDTVSYASAATAVTVSLASTG